MPKLDRISAAVKYLSWPPSIESDSRRSQPSAAARLWAAVLEDAIDKHCGRSVIDDQERKELARWFRSGSRRVGHFGYVCHVLGLEPGCVLEMIRKRKEKLL